MAVPVATLYAERGPATGRSLSVSRSPFTIGRAEGNDLVLADSPVSRQHACLEMQAGRWVLRDLGSSNGTLLNGQKVDTPVPLHNGDVIGIGNSALVFREQAAAAEKAPAKAPVRPKAKDRRRAVLLAAVAAIVLIAVIVAVVLILSGRPTEEETPTPGLPEIPIPSLALPTGLPELPTGMPSLAIPSAIPTGLSIPSGLPIPTGLPFVPNLKP